MSLDSKGLAQVLINLRESLNLSQSEVARRSKHGGFKGISNGYLSQLESGLILPETLTIKKINALARGFKIPPQRLFDLIIGNNKESEVGEEISNYINDLPEWRRDDLLGIAKYFFAQSNNKLSAEKPTEKTKNNEAVYKPRPDQSGEKDSLQAKNKKKVS